VIDRDCTLRDSTAADREFLQTVYAESRAHELAAVDWTDDQKAEFCRQQFDAQDAHYREHYPDCRFLVVECGGEPVGRLYVDRRPDEIRVVDIALRIAARGRGLGGRLMREVMDEAAAAELPVRIHVERTNPARRLYDRLGFVLEQEGEVYDRLVWKKSV